MFPELVGKPVVRTVGGRRELGTIVSVTGPVPAPHGACFCYFAVVFGRELATLTEADFEWGADLTPAPAPAPAP